VQDLHSVPRRLTLAVLLAGAFTVSFTITLLVVSLPRVATDLGSTVSVMSWTIIAPMLSFGVVGPAFGKAGDLWGHKRMFVGGLVLAGIFSVVSGFAWNAVSLIVLRTLAAGAGSATGPAAMAYINRMFAGHERVRPLGYWSFVTAGAPVFGVVAGAPLVEAVGWRVIFLVQGPLCVLGAVLAVRMLVDTERQRDVRFDVAGSALLGTGSVLVLVAINRGNAWGWGSPLILGCAAGGIAALWAFVRTERRTPEPLLPLHWLRTRNVAVPLAISGLMTLTYMGSFLVVPQMLQEGLGYSPSPGRSRSRWLPRSLAPWRCASGSARQACSAVCRWRWPRCCSLPSLDPDQTPSSRSPASHSRARARASPSHRSRRSSRAAWIRPTSASQGPCASWPPRWGACLAVR
jgi:MFS family permease